MHSFRIRKKNLPLIKETKSLGSFLRLIVKILPKMEKEIIMKNDFLSPSLTGNVREKILNNK